MVELFQLILQIVGIIFLAITSIGSIKYLYDSWKQWRLRKKLEKLTRKEGDKTISTEKKIAIKEKLKNISIKRDYSNSARNILKGESDKFSTIEKYLSDISYTLDKLNDTLKCFKGYEEPKIDFEEIKKGYENIEKEKEKSNKTKED